MKRMIEGTVVVSEPSKAVVRSFLFPVTDATRLVCKSSSVEFFVEGKSVYFYELKKIFGRASYIWPALAWSPETASP